MAPAFSLHRPSLRFTRVSRPQAFRRACGMAGRTVPRAATRPRGCPITPCQPPRARRTPTCLPQESRIRFASPRPVRDFGIHLLSCHRQSEQGIVHIVGPEAGHLGRCGYDGRSCPPTHTARAWRLRRLGRTGSAPPTVGMCCATQALTRRNCKTMRSRSPASLRRVCGKDIHAFGHRHTEHRRRHGPRA